MASKNKTKKQAQVVDKSVEENQNASTSNPFSSEASMGGDEEVSLTKILNELREFRRDNKQDMDNIKGEITKTYKRLDEAETRITNTEDRVQGAEDVVAELLKLQEQLQSKLTDLEGRSRRENVRIYGIPEGAEGSPAAVITFVEKLLRENLGIAPTTDLHIERAHRALAPLPPADSQPRSIVVRFLSYRKKEEVLKMAWEKKGFIWNNNKINLDHDYAPDILARRREYGEIRRILRDNNVRFQTLFPARLRVFFEGETKTYDTVEEASTDLADRGLPVTRVVQPDSLLERLQRYTWKPVRARRKRQTAGEPGYKEKLQAFTRDQVGSSDA